MMKPFKLSELPVDVRKLKKHSWAIALRWPGGYEELIDGFDSKRQAKNYKAKAADLIALRLGAGFYARL